MYLTRRFDRDYLGDEDMFSLVFTGNIGNEPNFIGTKGGATFGRLSVAIYRGADKQPLWVDVELWESDVERAMKFVPLKGRRVTVMCNYPINVEAWQNKEQRLGVNISVKPTRIEYGGQGTE